MHMFVLLLLVGTAAAGLAPLHKVDGNIKDKYLIKFKDEVDVDSVTDGIQRSVMQRRLGRANVSHRYYRVVRGMAAELSEEALQYIRSLDEVEYVSDDAMAHAAATGSWGLDRIDERDLPLDNYFSTNPKYKQGAGVEIWVVDTGILPTHVDFGGRASVEYDGYGGNGIDCNGHGTHCAGTTGGTTYGVAKQATIKGVKVLGNTPCSKYGSYSTIVGGLDYVVSAATLPAVVSISIGGGASSYVDDAVTRVVNAGIPFVTSAGNEHTNACNKSPARASSAITVGATDVYDSRASYSNWGPCLDIFAPGTNIVSAYYTSNYASKKMSGTSMACPHVAGICALYLAENPNLTPSQVTSKLVSAATPNVVYNAGSTSPNLLAYIDPLGFAPPRDS